jgi:hypothetical protein
VAAIFLTFIFRSRVRIEWQNLVELMDASGSSACPGEAPSLDEYRRVALTVAFALSNPCK